MRIFVCLMAVCAAGFGCTDFLIETGDGTHIEGRSMEFAQDLESEFVIQGSGKNFESKGPKGALGEVWTNRYGYVFLNALGQDLLTDGMNEKGLSLSVLWMPGSVYESRAEKAGQKPLLLTDAGDWILGNFATVDEVEKALQNVWIWGEKIQSLGGIPPIHLSVYDAEGNGIVIEWQNGKRHVYKNVVHTLTNYPPYPWQLINQRNYINLTALNHGLVELDGTVLGATGEGSGLLGIPGDWTPPSRFTRIVIFKDYATRPKDAAGGVNLALHLLNTVDIPKGDIRPGQNGKSGDYSQWIVVKDLTNREIYFRSYGNLNLKKIDLKKLDFQKAEGYANIPVTLKEIVEDVTP